MQSLFYQKLLNDGKSSEALAVDLYSSSLSISIDPSFCIIDIEYGLFFNPQLMILFQENKIHCYQHHSCLLNDLVHTYYECKDFLHR
jgi:hypothetical protein